MVEEEEQPKSEKEKKLMFSKSWKTYLLELISLSLAVFLGFLAENFREEISEQRRAAELAQNLYDELLADSIAVERTIAARVRISSALLDLKDYVRDSSISDVSNGFIKNFFSGIHFGDRFQPTDVMLEQLKTSGSLAFFKSKEVQQTIRDLGSAISFVKQRNQIELEFGYTYIIPFNIDYIDQEYFPKITNSERVSLSQLFELIDSNVSAVPFEINNLNQFKRKDVINMILVYRNLIGNGASACQYYRMVNNKLLIELRNEYPIEKEGSRK